MKYFKAFKYGTTLLFMMSNVVGCARYGGPTAQQSFDFTHASIAENNVTRACNSVRHFFYFPPTADKAPYAADMFRYVQNGICAPYSDKYDIHEFQGEPPYGPRDAAWSEPVNAAFRGKSTMITQEMLLREDFRRGGENDYRVGQRPALQQGMTTPTGTYKPPVYGR